MGCFQIIKRLGKRAGIADLHTHRFRHSYAVNVLRAGMPERVLEIVGGWKKIPKTYFRTLGEEDAMEFHRQVSPGDRLGRAPSGRKGQPRQGPWRGSSETSRPTGLAVLEITVRRAAEPSSWCQAFDNYLRLPKTWRHGRSRLTVSFHSGAGGIQVRTGFKVFQSRGLRALRHRPHAVPSPATAVSD